MFRYFDILTAGTQVDNLIFDVFVERQFQIFNIAGKNLYFWQLEFRLFVSIGQFEAKISLGGGIIVNFSRRTFSFQVEQVWINISIIAFWIKWIYYRDTNRRLFIFGIVTLKFY